MPSGLRASSPCIRIIGRIRFANHCRYPFGASDEMPGYSPRYDDSSSGCSRSSHWKN